MTRMLIRLSTGVPTLVLDAFPGLVCVELPAHTALVGSVVDQEELHGVLHHLNDLGIPVVEVLTIPEETDPPRGHWTV